MWHALVWTPLLLLIGLWSLLCWGVLALLQGPDWSSPGVDWLAWLEQWQFPAWLAEWLPMHAITMLKTWLTAWGPWLQDWLAQTTALPGWLQPLVWLTWGLGTAGLAFVGLVGSVLVAALTRRQAPGAAGRVG
jgi:hypothetical protein